MSRTKRRHAAGFAAATAIGAATLVGSLAGLAALLSPSAAWLYSFHEYRCCHERDCRPVPDRAIAEAPDGYVIRATGEVIAYADSRIRQSPDDRFHWCSSAGSETGSTLCLYTPARGF